VVVAGAVDVPPFIGVAGTLAGRAQLAGGGLTIRLNGCTPMTAQAIAMGEPPISDVTFRLCPTAQPLVTASRRDLARLGPDQGRRGLVNVAQARLEGVEASFVGGGRGFDVAQVKVTGGRVVEASTEGKRFETRRDRRGRPGARPVDRRAGRQDPGRPPAGPGHHPPRRGQRPGPGRHRRLALVFAKGGLQPLELTPLAAVARDAEGPVAFTGRFAWAGEIMTSEGPGVDPRPGFQEPAGPGHRLKGEIVFDSLAPLTSPARPDPDHRQHRRLVPIQGGPASFGLGAEALHLSEPPPSRPRRARSAIEPFDVPLDGKGR
jgi:hypothetical protein